jgi:lipopolysaccharide/colanic/teichoic acid biosynthesis glycosyltransferase
MHDRSPVGTQRGQALVTRQRFNSAGAMLVAAVLPLVLRLTVFPDPAYFETSIVSFLANVSAVGIATWSRLSVGAFPGTRGGTLIAPSLAAAHGLVFACLLMTRLPYDRFGIMLGFGGHLVWAIGLHLAVHRKVKQRFAVVPCGDVNQLDRIERVHWWLMRCPSLEESQGCDAIVADFSADLPPEWERLLADAALAGHVVYQVKQLSESLTGRVEVEHLSENSFGGLLPARGYFHLKFVIDYLAALMLLPILLLPMLCVALAIKIESRGPVLFRQQRIGLSAKPFTVFKFRTMDEHEPSLDLRSAAMTQAEDDRITRVGRFLRRTRIDELPQLINILRGEMSWIGPRPETTVLSDWYFDEIPFYRYRHVIRPGISGWAQVNQGHVAQVDQVREKLQYDFFYIKYFSPWLDLLILFRTVRTMLTGEGSR